MNYEVRKVANGYIVMPLRDIRMDRNEDREIHVFQSWGDASTWLFLQFGKVSGG